MQIHCITIKPTSQSKSKRLSVMKFLIFFVSMATIANGVKHNLPDDVELVDPKSLGFDESQIDLSSILGNVKLQPVVSNHDPATGLKTQVLTVGFENEDNLNLDDFELPSNGNNSELVQNAFNSFKEYVAKKPVARRRKVKKVEKSQPKVVELDSEQIEKLLATGKLKSKKVGDSSVIEITQEQLNDLYNGESGGEFRQLLGGGEVAMETKQVVEPSQVPTLATLATTVAQQPIETTTTEGVQNIQTVQNTQTTLPPIVYEFNTKDLHNQQYVSYQPIKQQFPQKTIATQQFPQKTIQQFPQQQQKPQQQRTQISSQQPKPTFEFISVPPSHQYTSQLNPIPSNRGRVIFPPSNRFHRSPMNTFYSDDGLNYKDNNNNTNDYLRGV